MTATTTATTAISEPAARGVWRDTERCYRAVTSRDSRFDGQFIMAVRTTGIYCRPSCPALTPKPKNVSFFPTSAAAQAGGYRACRRCLPDAVPGSPEWNVRADLAARAMRLISDGAVERDGVPGLAKRLGYSERQLGRVLTAELGAGPLALARAHRAHSARLLIEMSELSLTDVAFAAGFASVRQFNETIREVFATTPSELRVKSARRRRDVPASGTRLSLRLPFRAPFDAAGALAFLADRAIPGVEDTTRDADGVTAYGRTLRLAHGSGTVRLTAQDDHVRCELQLADLRDLGSAVARVRRLLDLDADPEAVARVLGADPALGPLVAAVPGIRVPGAVDGPELVLRAVLGQAAGPLAETIGERLPSGDDALTTLFPTPAQIAEKATVGPAILEVATALADGTVDVHVGRDPEELRAGLLSLPAIGPRIADYVLMRVLGVPDVLLGDDPALRANAAALGITDLTERAQAWRPWRSYAGMYLWRASAGETKEQHR
jgi:AraC family transcriptional regulator of adaptative response / DNA-3-methyladenine glycosylase II